MGLLILGLILFIGLVVVHELGHFWVARRNGVEVEEFGIFFPPALWRRKTKAGWDFTINLLPLGGFVKLKGEYDSDKRKGSFGAASTWVKTKIMLAGVVVNLVTAVVMFMILAWVGMPKIIDNQFTVASDTKVVAQTTYVSYVDQRSPAAAAGLVQGDKLVTIAGEDKKSIAVGETALQDITKQLAGQKVTIVYERSGTTKTVQTTLLSEKVVAESKKTDNPKGYLGITPLEQTVRRSTWSAPVVALGLTAQFTQMTFQGLGQALQGLGGIIAGAVTGNSAARQSAQTQAGSQVGGPVAIFFTLKSGAALGLGFVLMIIALISLTLAIMNVLPIPALDGGRLFVMMVARILGKPLTEKVESLVYGIGFAVLIGLIVLITIVDVKRFF